jgi:hypothetical protein
MQLKINYYDGHSRVINPAPEFFLPDKMADRRTGKQTIITPQDKAMSLAYDLGSRPYHILLTRGTQVLLKHTIGENKPEQLREESQHQGILENKKGMQINVSNEEIAKLRKTGFTEKFIIGTGERIKLSIMLEEA